MSGWSQRKTEKHILPLPLIFITRVWVARILGNTRSKLKLVVLEPNTASYARAGIRAPILATDWDKLVHTVTGQTCRSNTEQRLGAHSFSTTQDTKGITEASLPSAPFSHLSFSNAGSQATGREVFVLPLCSFYSAFSIFPLNSLSLIPCALCFYLFLGITWGFISQYWFFFLQCRLDVRKKNS